MSGVGSSGKSGTPPIGHGPNAVVRSTQHNDDRKSSKKAKEEKPKERNKEGHDQEAVLVDASLFHVSVDDIFEAAVNKVEAERHLILDSQLGRFRLEGAVKLSAGDQVRIQVTKISSNIEGLVLSGAGITLSNPIPVTISPIGIHGENNNAEALHSQEPQQNSYSAPEANEFERTQEEAALLVGCPALDAHSSPQINQPKVKATPPLAGLDLSTIIEARAMQNDSTSHVLTSTNEDGHDQRTSVDKLLKLYGEMFPEIATELEKTIHGLNGHVPTGLSFFLAGMIFDSVENWIGSAISKQLENQPALKTLENDFNYLTANTNCLANENWRYVAMPHPDGGAQRAIKLITNILVGGEQDGDSVEMRTIVSQMNFQTARTSEKPLGKVQIEATIVPDHCGIIFRFGRELEQEEKNDIDQLVKSYYSHKGIAGHVLFAPFDAGHIDFQEISRTLKMEVLQPPSLV